MSAQQLQNIMRLQAMLQGAAFSHPRSGLVTAFHPASYCAKVKLQPGGQETGWIPVGTSWAGNGWGLFAPPSIDTQVIVLFQEGSIDVGVIVSMLYSTVDKPLSVDPGEFWLVHEDGAYIKFKNGGELQTAASMLTHTGPVTVSESLSADGNLVAGTGATGNFSTPTGQVVTVQDGIITNIY